MAKVNSTRRPTPVAPGLEAAIDEQRYLLFDATALVEVVVHALEREFGQDWPAKYPEFPRVLRQARKLIDSASGDLELGVLLERGLEIVGKSATGSEVSHG